MTRDEIYDHLAQVYLGKRDKIEERKGPRHPFNAWLVINIVLTAIILASAFYGLTAFLTHRSALARNSVIFALTNGSIRILYNLNEPFPPVKTFTLSIPKVNASKYKSLSFDIRGLEDGYPGVVKVVVRNQKNETSSFFVKNVRLKWQEMSIPFEEFEKITDWTNVTEVSFVLEAWNSEKKKGIILIDHVCFSS